MNNKPMIEKIRTIQTLKNKKLCDVCTYWILKNADHFCGCYVKAPANEIKYGECKDFAPSRAVEYMYCKINAYMN